MSAKDEIRTTLEGLLLTLDKEISDKTEFNCTDMDFQITFAGGRQPVIKIRIEGRLTR